MSKSTSDFLSTVDNLEQLHDRLSKVVVMNMDGVKLIEKYNTPETFIYCDPPYVQSTRKEHRYVVDMDDEGQKKFIDVVLQSKSKILISGYENEIYHVLEQNGFEKITFDVNTTDGNRRPTQKTEVLWKNY